MPTLRDISDRCGVSVQTASEVLNTERAKLFRPELRRKIEKIAAEIGYTPNRAARVLRGAKTRTIGVLLHGGSYLGGLHLHDTIAAIDETLEDRGYHMLQGFCLKSAGRLKQRIEEMLSYRVEGLLDLCGSQFFEDDVSGVTFPETLPIIKLNGWRSDVHDHVNISSREPMEDLMRQAVALGHQCFAFVCSQVRSNRDKYDAIAHVARCHGMPLGSKYVFEGATGTEVNSPFIDQLLALRPCPTWIACSNDFVAAGVIQGLRRRGIKVPQDISVSGHDGLLCMQHFDPPLTTLRVPSRKMGQRMAEMMLERIEQPALPPRVETFMSEVLLRESSGSVSRHREGDSCA